MPSVQEMMKYAAEHPTTDIADQIAWDGFPETTPEDADREGVEIQYEADGEVFHRSFAAVQQGGKESLLTEGRQVQIGILLDRKTEDVVFERAADLPKDTSTVPHLSLKTAEAVYRGKQVRGSSLQAVRKGGASRVYNRR